MIYNRAYRYWPAENGPSDKDLPVLNYYALLDCKNRIPLRKDECVYNKNCIRFMFIKIFCWLTLVNIKKRKQKTKAVSLLMREPSSSLTAAKQSR